LPLEPAQSEWAHDDDDLVDTDAAFAPADA
jgi:hypothetical protein